MRTIARSAFLLIFIGAVGAPAGTPAGSDASCFPRDYRAAVGPNRDQGDLGWCYAFTSADLITQRTGVFVSAADLATGFLLGDGPAIHRTAGPALRAFLRANPGFDAHMKKYRFDGQGDLSAKGILTDKGLLSSGGTEDVTLVFANLRGLCLERSLPSRDDGMMKLLTAAAKAHAERSRRIGAPASRRQDDATSPVLDPVAVSKGDFFREEVGRLCARVRPPAELIPRVLQWAETADHYRKLLRSGRVRVDREGALTMRELNRVLDSNRIAAIGWGADAFMTPDGDDDDHSSVIVARRLRNGVCHYLLRNSYGEDCSDYRPPFRSRCERGNVWVTADELVQTVYAVTSLE